MKIARLLEFHQSNLTPTSLSQNLGDGFLITKNEIYRDVRKKALSLGFTYSAEFNTNYLALPLSQLEILLKTKVLPYSDNVSALFEVEKQIPNSTVWDEVTDGIKKNYVFHESCHAIARSFSDSFFSGAQDNQSTLCRLLIEESFSNTCELLGIIHAEDTAHRIFYELNSYIFMYNDRSQLRKLCAEIGRSSAIQFLIGCYLFSNFLHDKITETDLTTLLKLFNLNSRPSSVHKTLRSVAKIAFELNPRFRWVTTTFYLRLNGLSTTPEKLRQIQFLDFLKRDERFLKLIESLSKFEMV